MKTITTAWLTRGYLEKLEVQNYFAITAAILIVSLSLFWLVFRIGGTGSVISFSDSMYAIASLIGACWAALTAYRMRNGPLQLEKRHQFAWLLIALGLFANCLGGFDYTILERIGNTNPVPSSSDIGFTLFYVFTFFGLLIMPTQAGKERFRFRLALDAVITTLCIFGVSWFFFLSKILSLQKAAHVSLLTLITVLSYPCWDILLILAIVLFIQRRTARILYPSLIICALGIFCQIIADTGYAYTMSNGTYYTSRPYIDPFWFIGYLMIGLSALYQYASLVRRAYNENTYVSQTAHRAKQTSTQMHGAPDTRLNRVRNLLIYLPLSILLALTLYSEIMEENSASVFLVVLTAVVGILVTVRYLLATRENEALLHEREQQHEASEHLQHLNAQLSKILELDPLLGNIVRMVTGELGFDAAMLLLIEEDDHVLSAQSHLLIRALPSSSGELFACRLHGSRIAYCTVLNGKTVEMFWPDSALALPKEIDEWQQEQRICTSLFVPLIYQEKILGSLAFSSRVMQPFSAHEHYIANHFAEVAATAIEHTRLYQATREHEAFAQAMANIATRLNSTFIEPGEIHQFICSEGATALRADYVLLYRAESSGTMMPLASYVSDQETPIAPQEWPILNAHDAEAQVLNLLQPVLVNIQPAYSPSQDFSERPVLLPMPILAPLPLPYQTTFSLNGQPSPLSEILEQRSVQTAILAPLIAYGDAVGLLILGRSVPSGAYDKKSFEFTDLPQAQDFSEQAAIAFTNVQLYQQQLAAHQRLKELDQLKDQFMITASHELRTPLTAVQGYLELLAQYDEELPTEQRREFLQKAQRSCDELVVLLDNVMDTSRLETEAGLRPVRVQAVSVQDMITSVVDLIEPLLTKEERELHTYIPPRLFVQADPGRLRQVLMNISTNALKYSPPRTPIAFSAYAVLADQGPSVVVSVTDKGKGIAPEDQAVLFQRFVRLESDINSPVRGSGLGLYISRRLTEAMNGKIWIESRGIPGEGSTFHVQFPMATVG